jgi:hypothetical protein
MADKPVTINTSIDLAKVPEIDIAPSAIKDPKTGTIFSETSFKNPKTEIILSVSQSPVLKNTDTKINLIDPKNPIKNETNLSTVLDPKMFARQ